MFEPQNIGVKKYKKDKEISIFNNTVSNKNTVKKYISINMT